MERAPLNHCAALRQRYGRWKVDFKQMENFSLVFSYFQGSKVLVRRDGCGRQSRVGPEVGPEAEGSAVSLFPAPATEDRTFNVFACEFPPYACQRVATRARNLFPFRIHVITHPRLASPPRIAASEVFWSLRFRWHRPLQPVLLRCPVGSHQSSRRWALSTPAQVGGVKCLQRGRV